jgi:ER membrane protein complex subunit 1
MHIFPHHDEAIAAFNNISTQVTFLLQVGPPTQRALEGRGLSPWEPPSAINDDPNYVAPAPVWTSYPAWRSGFAPGENVVGTIRSATALTGIPPASHGRVLGDRSTLYKYENPHLVAVLTRSHVRDANSAYESDHHQPHTRCTVYLMDSVKGTVLYSSIVPAGRELLKGPRSPSSCDVKMSLVENWLVYHYYDDDASGVGARGWRIVSVELYEGGANVRTRRHVCFYPFFFVASC